MTINTRDPDFVTAVREIFKEAAGKMLSSEKVVLQIEQLWLKAIEKERERMFLYLSREDVLAAFEDKAPLLGQFRWIVGNGTYLSDNPDMSLIPPFMKIDPSKYSVSTSGRDQWSVKMDGGLAGDQEVGRIEKSGNERKLDQPFASLDGAVKFFEAALQSLAVGMGDPLHLREPNEEENIWHLESSDFVRIGSIEKRQGPLSGTIKFMAVLYDGPDVEDVVDRDSFGSFEGAEQWLRMKASLLKRSA
jgi:hypothetical protein